MKRVLWEGALADLGYLDSVRLSGRSTCGNEKWIDAIVAGVIPPGHRVRLKVALEPIEFCVWSQETELANARAELLGEVVYASGIPESARAAPLVAAIERLVSARIARALRVHCDADHDDDV